MRLIFVRLLTHKRRRQLQAAGALRRRKSSLNCRHNKHMRKFQALRRMNRQKLHRIDNTRFNFLLTLLAELKQPIAIFEKIKWRRVWMLHFPLRDELEECIDERHVGHRRLTTLLNFRNNFFEISRLLEKLINNQTRAIRAQKFRFNKHFLRKFQNCCATLIAHRWRMFAKKNFRQQMIFALCKRNTFNQIA